MIGVEGHVRIGEKNRQPRAALAHVIERLNIGIARREALTLQLPIDPVEELFDAGFAVRQAMQLLGFALEWVFADILFNGIQGFDLLDGFASPGGFGLQRLEERGVYPFMPFVAVSLENPCNQNDLQNALDDMLRRDFDQSQVLEISGIS